MKFNGIAIIGYVGLAVLLSSCSFVSQQLADKPFKRFVDTHRFKYLA